MSMQQYICNFGFPKKLTTGTYFQKDVGTDLLSGYHNRISISQPKFDQGKLCTVDGFDPHTLYKRLL